MSRKNCRCEGKTPKKDLSLLRKAMRPASVFRVSNDEGKMKHALLLSILLAAAVAFAGCANQSQGTAGPTSSSTSQTGSLNSGVGNGGEAVGAAASAAGYGH
jgi:hypothetical protein